MIAIIAILTYLAYCYLAYVILAADWERAFGPDDEDGRIAFFFSAFGPFSLVAALLIWFINSPRKV